MACKVKKKGRFARWLLRVNLLSTRDVSGALHENRILGTFGRPPRPNLRRKNRGPEKSQGKIQQRIKRFLKSGRTRASCVGFLKSGGCCLV